MNPANLTAAERAELFTTIDAVISYAMVGPTNEAASNARDAAVAKAKALCERLSAPVASREWVSVAVWPEEVHLGNTDNESRDKHPTFEAAYAVCRRLEREGFGGDRKIFPIRTRVEPPAQQPQAPEPVNAELLKAAKGVQELWDKHDGHLVTHYPASSKSRLNAFFDAIARAESALAAQKGGK